MDVRITVETTFDDGEKRTHKLDAISRPCRVTCLLEPLPHACKHAARHFTPTLRITWSPSWTTAAGIVLGCRFPHLAQKVRSMILPMPEWESVGG